MTTELENIISYVSLALGVLGALTAIYWLAKSGTATKIKLGSFAIETKPNDQKTYSELIESVKKGGSEDLPFEIEQLAKYYTQILHQTKISFWFSLVFATLGFSILLIIIFGNSDLNSNKTIISFISTTIIEAVSVLFFSRSNKAQKEMEQFFNKLRNDRQQGEARKLADSIENPMLKDILKIQLALNYSEIENDTSAINEAIKEATKKTLGNEVNPDNKR